MSAWSCPHEVEGVCQRIHGARCDPGMRGCVLEGKVRFANEPMNAPRKPVKVAPAKADGTRKTAPAAPTRRRLPF